MDIRRSSLLLVVGNRFLVSSFSASKLPPRYGWIRHETKRFYSTAKKKFRVLLMARCDGPR